MNVQWTLPDGVCKRCGGVVHRTGLAKPGPFCSVSCRLSGQQKRIRARRHTGPGAVVSLPVAQIVHDCLDATCWCEREVLPVPVALLTSGQTLSCGRKGCEPS